MVNDGSSSKTTDRRTPQLFVIDEDGNEVGEIVQHVDGGGWVLGIDGVPLLAIHYATDGIGVIALADGDRPTHMLSKFADGRVEFMDLTEPT